MSNDSFDAIFRRLADVERQIALHERSCALLRKEESDLRTTLRVMGHLSGKQEKRSHLSPEMQQLLAKQRMAESLKEADVIIARDLETRKPQGTPTTSEMISEILNARRFLGEGSLGPKEILTEIRKRWWPDARSDAVGPIAWRMWKEGRLLKEDGRYSLPNIETPGAETPGASEMEEDFDEKVLF